MKLMRELSALADDLKLVRSQVQKRRTPVELDVNDMPLVVAFFRALDSHEASAQAVLADLDYKSEHAEEIDLPAFIAAVRAWDEGCRE